MKIYSVNDPQFHSYGKVLRGYDTCELISAMKAIDLPEQGTAYEPSMAQLEACSIFKVLQDNAFGGMPTELGMCWGHNTRLNCLEYHRNSEINLGTHDFVLLLAKQDEINAEGKLDTARVMAFRVPAGVVVEVYATTLHYAPCHVRESDGFRVAVALLRGTNTQKPAILPQNQEDECLWACNKWLLSHAESQEAQNGAFVGLYGENIDIADFSF